MLPADLDFDYVDAFWDLDFLCGVATWLFVNISRLRGRNGFVLTKIVSVAPRTPARSTRCGVAVFKVDHGAI